MTSDTEQMPDDRIDPKPEGASQKPESTQQAPDGAQNPDDPEAEGGGHSPDQAQGVASDGDAGRG